MAFWDKWFKSVATDDTPVKTIEYKGFTIAARPYKDGGQYQLAGEILKDGKVYQFVRADKFADMETAADIALSKGQLIIDQMGEGMFKA